MVWFPPPPPPPAVTYLLSPKNRTKGGPSKKEFPAIELIDSSKMHQIILDSRSFLSRGSEGKTTRDRNLIAFSGCGPDGRRKEDRLISMTAWKEAELRTSFFVDSVGDV